MAKSIAESTKRLAINRANAQMVIAVAVASFVSVFCLIAAKSVWSQTRYQARVTTAAQTAKQQLTTNLQNFSSLVKSYDQFDSAPNNIIGGTSTGGTGPNDGDNAKIILDALPDTYDFPALTSSLEKVLTGFNITSITGTDDQVAQQSNTSSPNPQPVAMPFSFIVSNANYTSVQLLITTLQQSIRPIQIQSIDLSGGSSNMSLTVNAQTYYQPGKSLNITKQVVK